MPPPRSKPGKQPQPHGPLVFDTRGLHPGVARSVVRTVPAPADLGVQLATIPEGADLELDLRLEGVSEGVLVTATVIAPLAGQCARCLDEFRGVAKVAFQELFTYYPDSAPLFASSRAPSSRPAHQPSRGGPEAGEAGDEEPDGYLLDGDLLDLEPAVRDALVLELPLSPLCAEDCPGLCPECGARLADAGPGHRHDDAVSGVWAALRDFRVAGGDPAPGSLPPGGPVRDDPVRD